MAGAAVSATLVLGAGLVCPTPAAAAAARAPQGSAGVSVAVSPVAVHATKTQKSTGTPFKASEVTWPSAGSATLGLGRPAVKAHVGGAVAKSATVPVTAQAVADAHGAYAGPSSVSVKVLSPADASALGVSGLVFSATGSSPVSGTVKLGLDGRSPTVAVRRTTSA